MTAKSHELDHYVSPKLVTMEAYLPHVPEDSPNLYPSEIYKFPDYSQTSINCRVNSNKGTVTKSKNAFVL